MAALLRSARLLKFSPSGLLQITGTKRTGPPIGRLYSGALRGSEAGVCSRQTGRASGNVSSRLGPYAVGCVRNYAVATEQKEEGSTGVRTKQVQQFDWALAKLDSSVRRTGRITKTLLLRIFHDICRTGYPSGNQALLLLRSCGTLLPEMPLQERSELAHHIWEKLQELGAQYDVSHYNALLKVYLQNEFQFSPTDFLAKMEASNIQPNRVTYQRLIAAYCQNGNIEGASTILGFMKSKDLPITDAVFNSLVTGHARAGDIESAKNIFPVMKGAGIEPGPDTYLSLLNAYAEKGDLDSLKQTMEEAESADCSLMDRDIMQVIYTLAKAGHQQHIPEMVERLRHERGYVPDAMNLCLRLITQQLEDTAFYILKTFPTLQSESFSDDSASLGNFFLRHCVNIGMSLEKLGIFCKELEESKLHNSPLTFSLSCALDSKMTARSLELMKMLKEQDFPIRPHYFWPLLTQHVKDNNASGVIEVIKGMQDLGVSPDVETVTKYILPVFQNMEAVRQAFQEAGISLESENFWSLEVRSMAVNNLAELYAKLSDPLFPSLDLSAFRGSLIMGFKKFDDVESMVKITELLYKDERFAKGEPAETVSYFLYKLIDSMSEREVQTQEEKLKNYFNQLHTKNITIPQNIYRGIRNLLEFYNVPELIKNINVLVDPANRGPNGNVPAPPRTPRTDGKVSSLESKLAELIAENKPITSVLKQTIQALCAEENLQRALELKQQHETNMSIGAYASLIGLCCRLDNLEEALNLKMEMSQMDSSKALDANKYVGLVKSLCNNGRVEEAVDLLKEMKEKDVAVNDTHVTLLFHMLNSLVAKGSAQTIQLLLDTIFTLGLAKPSANLCSVLITVHLERDDLAGALEAMLECQKRYKQLPRIHDVIVGLVEKGDTALLQKAMDFVSQERGEMTMLYDLFFAFLQTGRYREARKIVETPGMRARPGRLQWFAEKCILGNQLEALEHMVDMTAKLFECDRDEMYSYALRLCYNTNNWQKAEALWTKMQEDNIIPRERTLRLLADILKNNGQKVPFEVPETWYQKAADTKEVQQQQTAQTKDLPTQAENGAGYQVQLLTLCKKGKAKQAYGMLKDADKRGMAFGPAPYDFLIRALLAEGALEDAMVVRDIAVARVPGFHLSDTANTLVIVTQSKKGQTGDALETLRSMLQADQVPGQLAITRLTQALGSDGNLAGIKEVESLLKSLGTSLNLSNMLFVNNKALAHIKNGDVESAVEDLEAIFTEPDNKKFSVSFVFRSVLKEDNDKALDKLSAMAERLANHFACYRPATDLFLQLVDMNKLEEAKFMLARCNAVADQKDILMSYVMRRAQSPGQVGKINALLSLIPDFVEKDSLYPYLMKCHALDKDLQSAKTLYEQIQKEGVVLDELSLKRLAGLYRRNGETVPFSEPPETFKFYAAKLKDTAAKADVSAEK
ncbi:leucine-rich PPR motif-containing protein, mitochondrial [Labrus mixtus]|uniref:leucine-rich PPR motif-containing protein, mitochondrial n=1 Tax=Labrus mixtus TaxID=508554 RepID=UPI0029BFCF72|nr:leucine-rich PPR motif-containing protein, mitochondrial [Labrus mixtus]